MKIIRCRDDLKSWRKKQKKKLGLVPTMGALHSGHASLVERALNENSTVAVSIFVNPTQFGPDEDLDKYPRTEAEDLALLKNLGVDMVYLPRSPQDLYPRQDRFSVVPPSRLTDILEGRFRPGHFEGVATVVLKLFQLIKPDRAYFGEKDYQQLKIIEAMVEDLFLDLEIVPCRTIRESSGLAMSSRNRYLSALEFERAAALSNILKTSPSPESASERLKLAGFEVDYVEVWDPDLQQKSGSPKGRWLAAVRMKTVRLIDNLKRLK